LLFVNQQGTYDIQNQRKPDHYVNRGTFKEVYMPKLTFKFLIEPFYAELLLVWLTLAFFALILSSTVTLF